MNADKAQCWKADRGGHVPNLAVFALGQGDFYPGCGNVCPKTNRRMAWPKIFGFRDDFRSAFLGAVAFDEHPVFQFLNGRFGNLPFYLDQIGSRVSVFRVEKLVDEFSVVGQKERALAVVVEPTRRINAFGKVELVQSPVVSFGSELAEDAERLSLIHI